jgi:YVTN family beta-propeller protein
MPGGREVVVTNEESHNVAILDGHTGDLKRTVAAPEGPLALGLGPGGEFILVGCFISNHLWQLDARRWTVDWRAAIGGSHVGLCVTPEGGHALVANSDRDHLSLVDLGARREVERITVGANPAAVAMVPGQPELAYVTDRGADTVTVVDIARARAVRSITVGSSPLGLCIG